MCPKPPSTINGRHIVSQDQAVKIRLTKMTKRYLDLNTYFRKRFGPIEGAVAVDLDERFAGWKLGILESVAIKRGGSLGAVVWGGCILIFY